MVWRAGDRPDRAVAEEQSPDLNDGPSERLSVRLLAAYEIGDLDPGSKRLLPGSAKAV
jgi:hypothetical protein